MINNHNNVVFIKEFAHILYTHHIYQLLTSPFNIYLGSFITGLEEMKSRLRKVTMVIFPVQEKGFLYHTSSYTSAEVAQTEIDLLNSTFFEMKVDYINFV